MKLYTLVSVGRLKIILSEPDMQKGGSVILFPYIK